MEASSARYNRPFDLDEIGAEVGYPLYMKPFDGGQWVGVTRIADAAALQSQYDASGERLMHLQASVEGFDVFARSLSIGAETTVMRFDPGGADARAVPRRARLPRRRRRARDACSASSPAGGWRSTRTTGDTSTSATAKT